MHMNNIQKIGKFVQLVLPQCSPIIRNQTNLKLFSQWYKNYSRFQRNLVFDNK